MSVKLSASEEFAPVQVAALEAGASAFSDRLRRPSALSRSRRSIVKWPSTVGRREEVDVAFVRRESTHDAAARSDFDARADRFSVGRGKKNVPLEYRRFVSGRVARARAAENDRPAADFRVR